MTEKQIDPKNPGMAKTAKTVEAENGPTEDSRTSQRVASRKMARKSARRFG